MAQLTTPPSPPLVVKVFRRLDFAANAPVAAQNLIGALREKYGADMIANNGSLFWVYDATGKPIKGPPSRDLASCLPGAPDRDLPEGGDGRRSYASIDLTSTGIADDSSSSMRPEYYEKCAPYTIAMAHLLDPQVVPPSQLMNHLSVTIQSPGLLRHSRVATFTMIKQAVDDQAKQQQDAGAKRAAPKL